jgi:uncharacterized SAM-binding protein YcdF (DUF218 family)
MEAAGQLHGPGRGRVWLAILGMAVLMGAFAIAAAGPVLSPPILQALGDFLIVRDPLGPADVVIAVSGDGTGERARTAAAILLSGDAQWLILSGSRAGAAPGGATEAMRRVALRAGVPEHKILLDDRSASTRDNARRSARLMHARGLRSAIVVTSPYHARRAAWIFGSEFRARGLSVRIRPADNSFFNVREWWLRDRDRGLVISEYQKLLAHLVGLR